MEPRSLYQTRARLRGSDAGWWGITGMVQKMMGHEPLQMTRDEYDSQIKNYQRDEGSAFMEKVYHSSINVDVK